MKNKKLFYSKRKKKGGKNYQKIGVLKTIILNTNSKSSKYFKIIYDQKTFKKFKLIDRLNHKMGSL